MFGNETIISVFFRFANLAVLLIFGTIVFKKYILPTIVEFLKEQQDESERLKHQRIDLEVEQKLITQELENDQLLCKKLKENIDIWRQKSDILITQREQKRQAMLALLSRKMEQQEKVRTQEKIQLIIAQDVSQKLRESLIHYFEQEEVGSQYISSIIAHMEKNIL